MGLEALRDSFALRLKSRNISLWLILFWTLAQQDDDFLRIGAVYEIENSCRSPGFKSAYCKVHDKGLSRICSQDSHFSLQATLAVIRAATSPCEKKAEGACNPNCLIRVPYSLQGRFRGLECPTVRM